MKNKIKIISTRNGVALIAVLAILLILTLIIPVMFSMADDSTKAAVKGTDRQKASYLARSGVEMTVSALRYTLDIKPTDTNYATYQKYVELYAAMKEKVANATYGIALNSNGKPYVGVNRLWLYLDASGNSKYVSANGNIGPLAGDSNYLLVGYTDTVVTYDGDPVYYNTSAGTLNEKKYSNGAAVNAGTAVGVPWTEAQAELTTGIIKNGFMRVDNDTFVVKSVSKTLKGSSYTRSAAVVETKNMGSDTSKDGAVVYAGYDLITAPYFMLHLLDLNVGADAPDLGGLASYPNLCFADPRKANSQQAMGYQDGALAGGGYYEEPVYVYSTIGNMYIHVDIDRSKNLLAKYPLTLSVWSSIHWRDIGNRNKLGSMDGHSVNEAHKTYQSMNFISFCATNTLEVDMPIDVRVNATRNGFAETFNQNISIYKILTFQAKNVVFDSRADMFVSLYITNRNGEIDDQTGRRMGTIVLTAPSTTPYSYVNQARGKTVSAGKVYFLDDVYVWVIAYDNEGTRDTAGWPVKIAIGSTYYNMTESNDPKDINSKSEDCFGFKVFNKGDVYYFNADVADDNGNKIGVSLVNWYIETKYYTAFTRTTAWYDLWGKVRYSLYKKYIQNSNTEAIYKADDMKFIGNIYKDPTLKVPDIKNDPYVVWDN